MKARLFIDIYRPIGECFYAKRWSGSNERGWKIFGIDKYWHYIVAHGLPWFFAKLYVDRLNRIAKIYAGEKVMGWGHIRHFADFAAIARGEVEA